mgnify:CR=1 FL=1
MIIMRNSAEEGHTAALTLIHCAGVFPDLIGGKLTFFLIGEKQCRNTGKPLK